MCCFSAAVSVSNTSIFARDAGDGRQYLIYSMYAKSTDEVSDGATATGDQGR